MMRGRIEFSGFDTSQKEDVGTAIQTTLVHIAFKQPYDLSITLANNAEVQKLNAQYRDKDKATNVLSFPAYDPAEPHPIGEPVTLGDIVLAHETIEAEAAAQNKPYNDHLIHLAVHGALHLLGYDHENDADADIMENLEVEILEHLNIKNPYA